MSPAPAGPSVLSFYPDADLCASVGPDVSTVRDLIDRMAEERPDFPYLLSPETGEVLSFRGLRDRARLVCVRLQQGGLKKGEKVAFLLDNGVFTAELFLGAMYGGMISVPLNVNAGLSQLVYMLDHCDASVVFVGVEYTELICDVMNQVKRSVTVIPVGSEDVLAGSDIVSAREPPPMVEPEDVALLMYSSGSTGRSKAAVHSHRALLAAARNSVCAHQLTSADRSLLLLPIYHINAECVTLLPTLLSGGSVVIPDRFRVSHFWDWLEAYSCTWSAVVPTIISQLLDWEDPRAGGRDAAFRRLRFLRSSSAPLAPSLQREFIDKFHVLLIQAMGSSEAGNVFSNPLPPSTNKIGSPGLPWGFETRIIDKDGAELPCGEAGEVVLRGPALMDGYYKEPKETAAVLDSDGWLHTGDLAYRDADGYFFVVGRSKELIIKSGVNIAPRQIDDVLEAHPTVLEAAAVGVPDHHLGEDIVAFVVLRAEAKVDEGELLSFCERRLGHFKTPTRIYFAEDLPKGPSGKVQRLKLRDGVSGSQASVGREDATTTSVANEHGSDPAEYDFTRAAVVRKIIVECWSEVLGTPELETDRNFFALGGHSLLAVQCIARLREKIPVALSLSDFFDNGTIAKQVVLVIHRLELAREREATLSVDRLPIEAGQNEPQIVSSEIPLRDASVPYALSPGQRQLWLTEQLSPGEPLFNESEAVLLVGELNFEALEQAAQTIVSRHEILRTTVHGVDQLPVAVAHAHWSNKIKQIDLSELSSTNRRAALDRLLVEEPRQAFHLESEPGFRLTLVRLGPCEHALILMMHHIISDWASEGVFWREFSALYGSFVSKEPITLSPLTIQYRDYAAWRGQGAAETTFADDLAYWDDNLRGVSDFLDLPTDRPRPAVLSKRGARLRVKLNPTLAKGVRQLAQQSETTLFTVFVAALNVLLYRYTGKDDILVGIPVSDRERNDLQALIGFFLDVHVLRTKISGDMTFRRVVNLVQKRSVELYQHRAVPFVQVIERVQPARSLSYSTLFQVMFIWRNQDQMLPFIGLKGLKVEALLAESRTSKVDLTLFATDCGDEIWLDMEYSTDLFSEARIARMLEHYQTLLQSVVADPDSRVGCVPMLAQAELERLLIDFNRTEVANPTGCRIHDLFQRRAEQSPDAIAASFGGVSISFRELDQRSNQLAHHLRAVGVTSEALTVICLERSIEMIVAMIAVLKAGGAYVPVDPTYPPERISFMLEDSGATAVITAEKLTRKLRTGAARVIRIDADGPVVARASDSPFDGGATPESAAYVIYTSGSTGRPKGVVIPHRAVVNFLLAMSRKPGLTSNDTILAVTTLAFDIAALEIFLPLTVGARIELASRENTLDPSRLSSLIRESGANVIQATPATWRMLIDWGWKGDSRLKALCGGEALSRDLADQLLQRAGEVWNMYGPTETTIWSTVERVTFYEGPVLIGRPIDNTQVYILDSNRQPVPPGISGELFIAGAGLAHGYLNQPNLTAERFVANPFAPSDAHKMYRTGDLARFYEDGRIECLGRVDDQVKLRGFRIELGEVESVLKNHPCVRDCVVVASERGRGDRRLVAHIIPCDSALVPAPKELRDFLKQQLPEYMIPSRFVSMESFPRTANGKIDRKTLTGRGSVALQPEDDKHALCFTSQELELLQIWRRTLSVHDIGVRDNFFELGGHSLMAVQLLAAVKNALGVTIDLPTFFSNPTIEGTARCLPKKENAQLEPRLVPLHTGPSEGSLIFLDFFNAVGVCGLAQLLDIGSKSFVATNLGSPSIAIAMANGLPLEEVAKPVVDLIVRQQVSRPCVLVGHCVGAILAFEVAHQLQRHGVRADMIVLLDGWRNSPPWGSWIPAWRARLRWGRLKSFSPTRAYRAMRSHFDRLWSATPFALRQLESPGAGESIASSRRVWQILPRIVRRIRRQYQWQPLDSHGLLVRASDDGASVYTSDGSFGWSGLFREGLDILDAPGDHNSMLDDHHLPSLAQALKERMSPLLRN